MKKTHFFHRTPYRRRCGRANYCSPRVQTRPSRWRPAYFLSEGQQWQHKAPPPRSSQDIDSWDVGRVPPDIFVAAGGLITSIDANEESQNCQRLTCVCVCVRLTSSREGLSSDRIPIAGRIHPPQRLRCHTPSRLHTSASPWGDDS